MLRDSAHQVVSTSSSTCSRLSSGRNSSQSRHAPASAPKNAAPAVSVILSVHEGVPIAMELPRTVTFEIADTEPSVKGQTASSSYKPAILTNGQRIMVPPYITAGTRVVILTEDWSYSERAKD